MQASSDVQGRAPAAGRPALPPRSTSSFATGARCGSGRRRARTSPALTDFFRALSRQSLYNRFHGTIAVDERLADESRRSGLRRARRVDRRAPTARSSPWATGCVCATRAPRRPRSRSPTTRRGSASGRGCWSGSPHCAGEAGIERFVAEVLPGNVAMLEGLRRTRASRSTREIADGTVEIAFPIAATSDYVDARRLARPRRGRRVAASFLPAAHGRRRRRVRARGDDRRRALPQRARRRVRRRRLSRQPERRAGRRACAPTLRSRRFPTRSTSPSSACRASTCSRPRRRRCAPASARSASSRPALPSSAREGRASARSELLSLVRAHGARLLGPNCLGIASDAARLNATFAARPIPSGNIGFSSQSGALGLALLEAATGRDLGLSAFVSIGNKADVSSNDLLEWWEDDDATDARPALPRVVRQPAQVRASRAARRATQADPRAEERNDARGRSRRELAHRRARRLGRRRRRAFPSGRRDPRRDARGALDVAALLSSQPLPRGRRVGLLTNAGGLGILCADACEAGGLELPSLSPETRDRVARDPRRRGERRKSGRHARRRNAGDLRARAAACCSRTTDVDAVIVLFVPPVERRRRRRGGRARRVRLRPRRPTSPCSQR